MTNPISDSGLKSGFFGGVAFFAVIFYASGIPRVQRDVLQKIPFIGGNFVHEIPASDNVSPLPPRLSFFPFLVGASFL